MYHVGTWTHGMRVYGSGLKLEGSWVVKALGFRNLGFRV